MSTSKRPRRDRRRVEIWFKTSIFLDRKNNKQTISSIKKKFQDGYRKDLKSARNGSFWLISSFKWRAPVKPATKYGLTVFIREKPVRPIPPSDPTVPPPPKGVRGM